ncbi:MAG: hypothetical protein V1894_03345 [Chloroflexota bacterium]
MRTKGFFRTAVIVFLVLMVLGTGCSSRVSLDRGLKQVTKPYEFSLFKWEIGVAKDEFQQLVLKKSPVKDSDVASVEKFFTLNDEIKSLTAEMNAIKAGQKTGDLISLEREVTRLQEEKLALGDRVEQVIESQIRGALSDEGVYHPWDRYLKVKVGFPPVNFEMEKPPYLLIISPRERISRLKEVMLFPSLTLEEIESIEFGAEKLGVSALVVELGGMATYPAFVDDAMDLSYTFESAAEEYLHQYLSFKPIGFLYNLHLMGIRRSDEVVTLNETVASMLGEELGAQVVKSYYAENVEAEEKTGESGFDFNREMREIRITVDGLLAEGMVSEAETFMVERRQFLLAHGYYIRKLNQAYFAFHGNYADSPSSVDPIGAEFRELRDKSPSLKEFLAQSATITSREKLEKVLEKLGE